METNLRVMLSAVTTSQCVNITLVDDTIVETNETFLVQVEQVISSDDLTFGLDPEFTEVTILDNDGICTLMLLQPNFIYSCTLECFVGYDLNIM